MGRRRLASVFAARQWRANFPDDSQATVAIRLPVSSSPYFNVVIIQLIIHQSFKCKNVRVGDAVTLQGFRSSFDRAIPFDRPIFPSAVPAGERDRTSGAADHGTIWPHPDMDQIASGARQRSTAQFRLCNSDAGNITATSQAESKRL